MPLTIAQPIFDAVKMRAFNIHCRPLNRLREEHGNPPFGNDLRSAYTDADYTLYADAPAMFSLERLPPHHRFLGPILWSPPVPNPNWWNDLPTDKPIVYLTLGSSGSPKVMRIVIEALADQPVTVIASTAGAPIPPTRSQNLRVADYLPGIEAAARASLVICNGGSPTSQQALACGVPVLGVASNMDQFMNMAAIVRSGAGEVVRADRVSLRNICEAVVRMISTEDRRRSAHRLARLFNELNSRQSFRDFVSEVLMKQ